jgi:flagellar hook protein FlgE
MLDVTANNIANVNTVAFKSSATQFQDTLSQLVKGSNSPQATVGGTNPAQIGLGVQVAGISTNFSQGSTESTGRQTDVMISGDGFFVTNAGGQTQYTRAGSFDPDGLGHLVTPGGAIVQGWSAVNGVIQNGSTIGDITLPNQAVSPAEATTKATVTGNLPIDAATGTVLSRDTTAYDANGDTRKLTVTFTRTSTGWDASADDGSATPGTSSLAYTNGILSSGGSITVNGIAVDMTATTGFAGLTTVAATSDGRAAGTLQSFTMSPDGTLIGSFSNGASQAIGRIALVHLHLQLRRGPARNGRAGWIRDADQWCPGNVERRPVPGIHQPDRRAAWFPGQRENHHHLRPGTAGAHPDQAVAAPAPDGRPRA